MRYGTVVKSAVVVRKATSRVPASIMDPKDGQPEAGREADGGVYANLSAPADLKAVSYSVGARLSELTIRIVTTKEICQCKFQV
jgi:hypothetical protein